MDCSTLGFPVLHQSLLKLMSIESVMPSNHLVHFHCLLLLPSIFPSIRVFQWVRLCIRWPKIGASASAWVLPKNIHYWFHLGFSGWIFLQSWDSQESSPTPITDRVGLKICYLAVIFFLLLAFWLSRFLRYVTLWCYRCWACKFSVVYKSSFVCLISLF